MADGYGHFSQLCDDFRGSGAAFGFECVHQVIQRLLAMLGTLAALYAVNGTGGALSIAATLKAAMVPPTDTSATGRRYPLSSRRVRFSHGSRIAIVFGLALHTVVS
jgi:hypothetical protein